MVLSLKAHCFSCGLLTELDDQSHQKAERQAADTKKDKALSSAGIRVIRWQARVLPEIGAIKATFAAKSPDQA